MLLPDDQLHLGPWKRQRGLSARHVTLVLLFMSRGCGVKDTHSIARARVEPPCKVVFPSWYAHTPRGGSIQRGCRAGCQASLRHAQQLRRLPNLVETAIGRSYAMRITHLRASAYFCSWSVQPEVIQRRQLHHQEALVRTPCLACQATCDECQRCQFSMRGGRAMAVVSLVLWKCGGARSLVRHPRDAVTYNAFPSERPHIPFSECLRGRH